MPSRLSWRNLVPGLVALGAMLLVTAGVLLFAGIGRIRGKTVHLYVLTDQARGVMRGTEVWVSGQKVGAVDDVRFRAPSDDTLGRVVIAVTVRARDAQAIRRDSRAEVRQGANFVAPVVVYVAAGSPAAPAASEGDTIRGKPQSDVDVAMAKLPEATAQLQPIVSDVGAISRRVHDPSGTIGALVTGGAGAEGARLFARLRALGSRVTGANASGLQPGSRDSAGGEVETPLALRAQLILARVDSVRALIAAPGTSLGRFRRDSMLPQTIDALREELGDIQRRLASPYGTVGRARADSALTRSVGQARGEMTALLADIRRRPLRYVHF